MNIIDRNFYALTDELKSLTRQQIFKNIKSSFDKISEQTKLSLEDYFNRFNYWGKLDLNSQNYEQLMNKAASFSDHIKDYEWLYNKLKDYRSKKLLFAILNNWYKYDFITLSSSHESNFPHYFDIDLINSCDNEVFVDLGVYNGDTIIDFIRTYGKNSYKTIYGYEITKEVFEKAKNRLSYYNNIILKNKAILDEEKIVYLSENESDSSANSIGKNGDKTISSTTLDNDIKEKVTIIKMDIKGSEQKALLGCKKHIINDHPKLLLSVYHNNEDIWKIPKMIEEICPGYNFYLRSHGGSIYPTEITLIAIYDDLKL